MDIKNQVVKLQTKDHPKEGKPREKEFGHDHAVALLKRPNSQWELPKDTKFKFDGKDLSFKNKSDEKATEATNATADDAKDQK